MQETHYNWVSHGQSFKQTENLTWRGLLQLRFRNSLLYSKIAHPIFIIILWVAASECVQSLSYKLTKQVILNKIALMVTDIKLDNMLNIKFLFVKLHI